MHNSPFDPSEQHALANAEFFLTKSVIDAKINALFGELKAEIEKELKSASNSLPEGFPVTGGRIHRGEHYGAFPWRAVDCPAGFKKQGFLTFRTLLLWGHHFSFHLLLSGEWLDRCLDRLCASLPLLHAAGLQLSVQDTLWKWEFDGATHVPLSECTEAQIRGIAAEKGEVKLSRLHSLEEVGSLIETGVETWRVIFGVLFAE
jgi:hypothetical protein